MDTLILITLFLAGMSCSHTEPVPCRNQGFQSPRTHFSISFFPHMKQRSRSCHGERIGLQTLPSSPLSLPSFRTPNPSMNCFLCFNKKWGPLLMNSAVFLP